MLINDAEAHLVKEKRVQVFHVEMGDVLNYEWDKAEQEAINLAAVSRYLKPFRCSPAGPS